MRAISLDILHSHYFVKYQEIIREHFTNSVNLFQYEDLFENVSQSGIELSQVILMLLLF